MDISILHTKSNLLQNVPVRIQNYSSNNGKVGIIVGGTNQRGKDDLAVLICEKAEVINFERRDMVLLRTTLDFMKSLPDIPHPAQPPSDTKVVGTKDALDRLPFRLNEENYTLPYGMTAQTQRYLFQATMTDDTELRLFNILDEHVQNLVPGTCFNVAPRPGLLTEEGRFCAASPNDLLMLASSNFKMKLIVPSPNQINFVVCDETAVCGNSHINAELLFVRGMNVLSEFTGTPPVVSQYCSGFMLSSYGLWMHHSWCVDDQGRILEFKEETSPPSSIPVDKGPFGMCCDPGLRMGLAYAVVSVVRIEDRDAYLLNQSCPPRSTHISLLVKNKNKKLNVYLEKSNALNTPLKNISLKTKEKRDKYGQIAQQRRMAAQEKMTSTSYLKTLKKNSPADFLFLLAQSDAKKITKSKTTTVTRTTSLESKTHTEVVSTYHHIDFFHLELEQEGLASADVSSNAFNQSVRCMEDGISRNQYNHYKGKDPSKKPKCNHERVQGWKLSQCADCNVDLGESRLTEEQNFAKISELRDVLRANLVHQSSSPISNHQLSSIHTMSLDELIAATSSPDILPSTSIKFKELHGEFLVNSAVRVDWLCQFTFAHNCWDWPTWKVVRDIIVPATQEKRIRYCELEDVEKFVGKADVFMSHCWASKWGDLVMSSCIGAKRTRFAWIDIFAVRQFPGNGADLDFRAVVKASNALVMSVSTINSDLTNKNLLTDKEQNDFLTSEMGTKIRSEIPFFRLWCCVEIGSAVENGKPIVVRCGRAVRKSAKIYTYDKTGAMVQMQNLSRMVSVHKAECAVQADYDREIQYIKDNIKGGLTRINSIVEGQIVGALFSIAHGILAIDAAVCGEPSALEDLPFESSNSLCSRVLSAAAGAGRVNILKKLLRNQTILKFAKKSAALDAAKRGKHLDCIQLLLDAGAAPEDEKKVNLPSVNIENLYNTDQSKIAPLPPSAAEIEKNTMKIVSDNKKEYENKTTWEAQFSRNNKDSLVGEIAKLTGKTFKEAASMMGIQFNSDNEETNRESNTVQDVNLNYCHYCGAKSAQDNVRVRLINLKRTHLNGELGTRTTFDSKKKRFKVLLDNKKLKKVGYVNVQEKNLEIIPKNNDGGGGGGKGPQLITCTCNAVKYCCTTCQKNDWHYHLSDHNNILFNKNNRKLSIKFAKQSSEAGKSHNINNMRLFAQKSIEADKTYFGGYIMRGRNLASSGFLEQALVDFEQAMQLAKRENKIHEANDLYGLESFLMRARYEHGSGHTLGGCHAPPVGHSNHSSSVKHDDKNLDFGTSYTGVNHFRKHGNMPKTRSEYKPQKRFSAGVIVPSHTFEDAIAKNKLNPRTYIIPSLLEIEKILPLDMVKICWRGERFFVQITRKGIGGFIGIVVNKMNNPNAGEMKIDAGNIVSFQNKHILDIRPSSEAEQQMYSHPHLMLPYFQALGVHLDMEEFTYAVDALAYEKQKYCVASSAAVSPPSEVIKEENHVRVQLKGLSNEKLNGQYGIRSSYNKEKERYKIILDDKTVKQKGYVNVKIQNFDIISLNETTHSNNNVKQDDMLEFESAFSKKVESAKSSKLGFTLELYTECVSGNEMRVKEYIETNNVDVNNFVDSNLPSPLFSACQNGHINVVKFLLSCENIDVNKKMVEEGDGSTVTGLFAAIATTNVDIFTLLMNHPNIDVNVVAKVSDNTFTPLILVILAFGNENDNDILKTLFTMVHLLLNHPNIDIHKKGSMSLDQALMIADNQKLFMLVQSKIQKIDINTNINTNDEMNTALIGCVMMMKMYLESNEEDKLKLCQQMNKTMDEMDTMHAELMEIPSFQKMLNNVMNNSEEFQETLNIFAASFFESSEFTQKAANNAIEKKEEEEEEEEDDDYDMQLAMAISMSMVDTETNPDSNP
jgi:hypothetical protein